MDTLQAVVLGTVQGLTEFLPISSSGHLRIVPAFFGWEDPGAGFTAIIQLGTAVAVLAFFWRDILRIVVAWFRSLRDPALRDTLDARLGWYVGLGTIPISVVGVLFSKQIEEDTRSLYLIGTTLIVLALVLAAAERRGVQQREIESLSLRDGLVVGGAQALALVPGVSRSGATITAGLFLGLTRESAARFSFLLSVPAVLLSAAFEMRHLGEGDMPGVPATVVATVVSFAVGYAAIGWLLRWLVRHSTDVFVGYRLVLGAAVLVLVATGAIR